MDIGRVIFVLFIIFKIYSWVSKANANDQKNSKQKKTNQNKDLDDILGDFMKQIEQDKTPKTQTVLTNTDTHKASSDSHKELDWQEVTTSRFAEKKQLLKHSDYDKISHANENIETEEFYDNKEEESTFEFDEIDLRKAVLYKEILDRKYFTI